MAATAPRNVGQLGNDPLPWSLCLKQKGSTTCFPGTLAVIDAGYACPGRTALGLVAAGFFDFKAFSSVNAGADGDVDVAVKPGCRPMKNSAGLDAVTQAHVGKPFFIVDDDTVACRSNGTRSPGGIIAAVDSEGVWCVAGFGVNPSDLAGQGIQQISGTLVAGTCTINAGIFVTAASRAVVIPSANITGTTNFGELAHIIASNVAGIPGAGSIVIRALGDDGALDADAAGTFHGILIG